MNFKQAKIVRLEVLSRCIAYCFVFADLQAFRKVHQKQYWSMIKNDQWLTSTVTSQGRMQGRQHTIEDMAHS